MQDYLELANWTVWANIELYDACERLTEEEYLRARPSAFGSIHKTLNHLLAMDKVWLSRIEGVDHKIIAYDQILGDTLATLRKERSWEDARLIRVISDAVDPRKTKETILYKTMTGGAMEMPTQTVLSHIFLHHSHHRGQIHCMLSQTNVVPPSMDLTYFPSESK